MDGITLGLVISLHLGLQGNYNSISPHVRYEKDGLITGIYYNSMEKLSVYGGYRVDSEGGVGAEFGIVSGYDKVAPIVPYSRITYDIDSLRFYVAPGVEKWNDDINLGLLTGVEVKF